MAGQSEPEQGTDTDQSVAHEECESWETTGPDGFKLVFSDLRQLPPESERPKTAGGLPLMRPGEDRFHPAGSDQKHEEAGPQHAPSHWENASPWVDDSKEDGKKQTYYYSTKWWILQKGRCMTATGEITRKKEDGATGCHHRRRDQISAGVDCAHAN